MRNLSFALLLGSALLPSSVAFGGPVIVTANSFPNLMEGVTSISGVVGSFIDLGGDPASNFAAILTWGDGTTSTGTVISLGGGNFNVTGNHIYAEEGSYPVAVSVTDSDGSFGTGTGSATVFDAALTPLSSSPVAFSPGATLSNVLLGTFADANAFGPPSDFIVVINWGDGSSSAGTVFGGGGGIFSLTGTHTYNAPGTFTISNLIHDDGGAGATFKTTASSVPEPGSLALMAAGLLFLARRRRRA